MASGLLNFGALRPLSSMIAPPSSKSWLRPYVLYAYNVTFYSSVPHYNYTGSRLFGNDGAYTGSLIRGIWSRATMTLMVEYFT